MKFLGFLFICCLACSTMAKSSDLAIARHALGDGLETIAVSHAAAAETSTTNLDVQVMARLVQAEALAREGKARELVALLRTWPPGTNELFRYWLAWGLAHDQQPKEARLLLAAPFKDVATQALASRLMARMDVKAGNRTAAETAFRHAASALRGSPEGVENAVEWARAREAWGDLPGALSVLSEEKALECGGGAGESARLLGASLLMRTGAVAEADKLYQALVAEGTNVSETAFVTAACAQFDSFWQKGATNEAMQVVSHAVSRARRADLACLAGYRQAFAQFLQASVREMGRTNLVELFRRFPGTDATRRAHRQYADVLLEAGEAAAAVREYGNLLQAYPDYARDPQVLENRGWAYLKAGLRVEASGAFARAAQFAGTNDLLQARCLFKQGDALLEDGRYEEAAVVYARVKDPELASRARYQKADALARAKRADAAAVEFRAVLDEGGEFAVKAGLRLASYETSAGRPESAIELYSRLLGERNKTADAAILDETDADTNKVVAAGALKTKPVFSLSTEQRATILLGRGRASYMAYRWPEAEADFSEVARLQPARFGEMTFLSALCRYGAGRDAEAVSAVRELLAATTASSLRADLQLWLAKYDAAHGDHLAALRGFELCATNANLQVARQLEALVRATRCAAAIPDYMKVLDLVKQFMTRKEVAGTESKETAVTPLFMEALLLQSEALVEVARFGEAILVLERAVRLPGGGEDAHRRASILKADCLFAMGADDDERYRQAIEAYRVTLQDEHLTASQRLTISFKIGRALEKLRKFNEASAQYYANVVMAYVDGVKNRQWFDADASAIFARTVMMLADFHESRGRDARAVNILKYLASAQLPAADEARRRIAQLSEKGNLQ